MNSAVPSSSILLFLLCNFAATSEVLRRSKLRVQKHVHQNGSLISTPALTAVCQRDWTSISRRHHGPEVAKCMQSFVNAALPELLSRGGSPAFNIHLSEPALLSGVAVATNALFYAEITNVTVYGLSEALASGKLRFRYDEEAQLATATFPVPGYVTIAGRVQALLGVAHPLLDGAGTAQAIVVNGSGLLKAELLASAVLSTNEAASIIFTEFKNMMNRYFTRAFHLLFRRGWKVVIDVTS